MTPDPRSAAIERIAAGLACLSDDDAPKALRRLHRICYDKERIEAFRAVAEALIGDLFAHVDPELVEAVREAEAYKEQPPERPLNEWRERHEARVVAAKLAVYDAILAQLAAGRGGA
jgi:hypothetical protein